MARTNYDEALKLMSKGISGTKGVPISAVVYKSNLKKAKIKEKNSKGETPDTHAEVKCIEQMEKGGIKLKPRRWNMIVTIPPCENCLSLIKEKGYFNKVFYLVEEGQKYKFHGYLKEEKNIIKLFHPENDIQKEYVDHMKKRYIGYMKHKYGKNWDRKDKKLFALLNDQETYST